MYSDWLCRLSFRNTGPVIWERLIRAVRALNDIWELALRSMQNNCIAINARLGDYDLIVADNRSL
jgi:hypothetical protein